MPLAGVKLAPLVPEPGKIICLGLNYYDHAKEGGRDKPDYPWFFFRGATLAGRRTAQPALRAAGVDASSTTKRSSPS